MVLFTLVAHQCFAPEHAISLFETCYCRPNHLPQHEDVIARYCCRPRGGESGNGVRCCVSCAAGAAIRLDNIAACNALLPPETASYAMMPPLSVIADPCSAKV